MKTIYDFIKSWLYYPILKKWLSERNITGFKDGRFRYAIKHCRMKKQAENEKNNNFLTWQCVYCQETIEK